MHWALTLLIDAALVALVVGSYCAYQAHRRRQNEYARVQLYEDAERPCAARQHISPARARTIHARRRHR